jgi:hypothetical protein
MWHLWKRNKTNENKKSELVLHPSCHRKTQPFTTDPVSTASDFRLIGLEELPLKTNTKFQIKGWLDKFKDACDGRNILRFTSSEAYKAFDREGMEIWKKLRQELAPKYEIFYYSTRLEGLFRYPDAPMVKRIKLEAEYTCWATWYVDEAGCFDPVKLPITQETLQRLDKWQKNFDNTFNYDYPHDSKFPSEEEAELWGREGVRLWVQLQKELEPDYEVFRRIDYQGKGQLMKLNDWIVAFQGSYQEDIDNASQRLL